MIKKIIVTGATGSIGQRLVKELIAGGYEVTIFTRNIENAQKKLPNTVKYVKWNYERMNEWMNELNGVDVVVHLAGANLGAKRWTEEYKKLAYDSRVVSTKNLVEAIKSVEQKPKTFICASAVGYYGDRYERSKFTRR